MPISRFFWKIFLSFAVVIAIASFGANLILGVLIGRHIEADARRALIEKAELLEQILAKPNGPTLVKAAIAQSKSFQTRITLIALDGQVLAESGGISSELMENHRDRPELVTAAHEGTGFDERFSITLNKEMIYMARRVVTNEGSLFLRVALPLTEVKERIVAMRVILFGGTTIAGIVGAILAAWLARKITEPVERITAVSSALSQGDLKARIKDWPNNELGVLSRTVNALADSVEANIAKRVKMETIRSEFTSNISHELKTPLTAIRGYIELLEGGALHDQKNNMRFLGIMRKNVDRIIVLVADLLHLSAIEANEDTLILDAVEWGPVVEEVTSRLRPQLDRKQLVLSLWDGDLRPMPRVQGNRTAMSHILDNLVQNAISYTAEGGHISIAVDVSEQRLSLSVRDTGLGICSKDLERIFERFYRVDAARSRDQGGTGLGLAIVKHLVAQIHGTIQVSSILGQGSTFTVTLHLADPQANADAGTQTLT